MKKSSKPFLIFTVFFSFLLAAIILTYVGLGKECERMTKERYETEKTLKSVKNSNVNLIAQIQFLSSEMRITNLASKELGMIKSPDMPDTVFVDRDKIEDIKETLEGKYDKQ